MGELYPLIFILSAAIICIVVKSKDAFVIKALRLNILFCLYVSLYNFVAYQLIFRLVLKRPEAIIRSESFPYLNVAESLLAYTVAVLITLFVSSIIYKYIEQPFQKNRDRSRLKNA